jgi:hypothetical protein
MFTHIDVVWAQLRETFQKSVWISSLILTLKRNFEMDTNLGFIQKEAFVTHDSWVQNFYFRHFKVLFNFSESIILIASQWEQQENKSMLSE